MNSDNSKNQTGQANQTGYTTQKDQPIDLSKVKEQAESKAKTDAIKDSKIYLKWASIAALSVLLIIIASVVISGLSNIGSDAGSTIFGWSINASINPENKSGFKNLLKLSLTAVFLWLCIEFLKRKN